MACVVQTGAQQNSTNSTVPLSAAAPTVAAIIPNETDVTTGILLPNPPSPTCAVGITLDITNDTFALQNPEQPTASPVASVVLGNLSLAFANLNVSSLRVWPLNSAESQQEVSIDLNLTSQSRSVIQFHHA